MAKRKFDAGKVFGKAMAIILAVLMIVSISATLIYCLISM